MKGIREISNSQDVIDSRDVIARIEYLEGTEDEEEQAELAVLKALAEEGEGSPDWPHGETLIRDSYFKTYAQQLAEDCGMLKDTNTWPGRCIDWDQAVDELKQDYISVSFDGVDYWIRA